MNRIYKLVLVVEVSARSSFVLSMSVQINVITDINIFVQALRGSGIHAWSSWARRGRPITVSGRKHCSLARGDGAQYANGRWYGTHYIAPGTIVLGYGARLGNDSALAQSTGLRLLLKEALCS